MKARLYIAFDVFLILLAIGGSFLSFLAIHDDMRVVRVVSNSMAPAIQRGDSLVFKSIPVTEINKGQILLLPVSDKSGTSYVHRVLKKEVDANGLITVQTKGDANPVSDNWKLTITSATVPAYVTKIPMSYIPIVNLQSWIFLLVAVVIVMLLTPTIFRRKERARDLT